jgi:hypothetical protein
MIAAENAIPPIARLPLPTDLCNRYLFNDTRDPGGGNSPPPTTPPPWKPSSPSRCYGASPAPGASTSGRSLGSTPLPLS